MRKYATLHIYLSAEELSHLKRLAVSVGVTDSQLARDAVLRLLQRERDKNVERGADQAAAAAGMRRLKGGVGLFADGDYWMAGWSGQCDKELRRSIDECTEQEIVATHIFEVLVPLAQEPLQALVVLESLPPTEPETAPESKTE